MSRHSADYEPITLSCRVDNLVCRIRLELYARMHFRRPAGLDMASPWSLTVRSDLRPNWNFYCLSAKHRLTTGSGNDLAAMLLILSRFCHRSFGDRMSRFVNRCAGCIVTTIAVSLKCSSWSVTYITCHRNNGCSLPISEHTEVIATVSDLSPNYSCLESGTDHNRDAVVKEFSCRHKHWI